LLCEYIASDVFTLPLSVLGILKRKIGQLRIVAIRKSLVTNGQLTEKDRDRPSIRNDVVHGQNQKILL